MFSMLSRSISPFISVSWTLRVPSITLFQSSLHIFQSLEQSSSILSNIGHESSFRTKVSRWLANGIRKPPMNPFTVRYIQDGFSTSGSINIIPFFRDLSVKNSSVRFSLLNSFESYLSLHFYIWFITIRYFFFRLRHYKLLPPDWCLFRLD